MIYTVINRTINNHSPISTFLKVHKVYFTCFLAVASTLTFFNIHFICNALINLSINDSNQVSYVNINDLSCGGWEGAIYNKNCRNSTSVRLSRVWSLNPMEQYDTKTTFNITNTTGIIVKPWRSDNDVISESPTRFTGSLGQVERLHSKQLRTISDWQRYNPLTCNILHEIDMSTNILSSLYNATTKLSFLSKGSQRGTWILSSNNQDPIILKTLLWKEFTETKYRLQRIDAIATERLSSSPYVVNGYGFCGMSILNEYANDGDLHHYLKHHYNEEHPISSYDKLILTRDSALGLADIHGIDYDLGRATLLHRDIRPHNFLVVNGKLKFHDFNNAQLLLKNPYPNEEFFTFGRDTETCTSTESEVYPKAPEECIFPQDISEKMEIYRLGVFFFKLLTGDLPYKFETVEQPSLSTVLQWVLDESRIPRIPSHIEYGVRNDSALQVINMVMRNCTQFNPDLRPTARELADILTSAVKSIEARFS